MSFEQHNFFFDYLANLEIIQKLFPIHVINNKFEDFKLEYHFDFKSKFSEALDKGTIHKFLKNKKMEIENEDLILINNIAENLRKINSNKYVLYKGRWRVKVGETINCDGLFVTDIITKRTKTTVEYEDYGLSLFGKKPSIKVTLDSSGSIDEFFFYEEDFISLKILRNSNSNRLCTISYYTPSDNVSNKRITGITDRYDVGEVENSEIIFYSKENSAIITYSEEEYDKMIEEEERKFSNRSFYREEDKYQDDPDVQYLRDTGEWNDDMY